MQKDFVTRVHNCKINQKYSILVQEYIQYIERHLEEKFSLNDLADSLGYTDYDMSRRFKKETSVPLSEFIRDKRLERAKFLLRTPKLPVMKYQIVFRLISSSVSQPASEKPVEFSRLISHEESDFANSKSK